MSWSQRLSPRHPPTKHKTISASISLQNRLDEIGMNTWAEGLIATKERGVDNKKVLEMFAL